ncbi:hypothetical protein GCM10009795_100870 [Nocardioides hankookensis]
MIKNNNCGLFFFFSKIISRVFRNNFSYEEKKILKMIDMFEDLDDVQNVYTNVEFSDEVLAELDA